MTFTLTPLSHYNSITELRARFLLSLMEDLIIDFSSHFITSILDVYLDTVTYDKLIFPSAISRILQHFSIPIPLSPLFTTMGTIFTGFVQQMEAQLRPKWPRMEMTDPAASAVPPLPLLLLPLLLPTPQLMSLSIPSWSSYNRFMQILVFFLTISLMRCVR